jgi:hypothetical protein
MDFFRARFFWQESQGVKKYHLVNWPDICNPKAQGGLGVLDLDVMNISLLTKWLWKLESENGIWQDLIQRKYLHNSPLCLAKAKQGSSQFWRNLMAIKDEYCSLRSKCIGNGGSTSFWSDTWLGREPLAVMFPRLFDLCFDKKITVREALLSGLSCLRFRRTLMGETASQFDKILESCNLITLSDEQDDVRWKLGGKNFSVRSLYQYKKMAAVSFPQSFLWKLKIPHRIKIFIWLTLRDSILTKVNLKKRGWKGIDSCPFCGVSETSQHLFFDCPLARYVWRVVQCALGLDNYPDSVSMMFGAWGNNFQGDQKAVIFLGCAAFLWSIWNIRNKACFHGKLPHDPIECIFSLCHWIDQWKVLQKKKVQEVAEQGSLLLRRVASEAFNRACGWAPVTRMLKN